MRLANRMVKGLLRSPFHGLLSGSTDVIRYIGRRSGREISTPTQYATRGDDIVILVGRADSKQWWRNFSHDRDVDILVRGAWRAMRARAVVGRDEPESVAPLLAVYLRRFPRAAKSLGGANEDERVRNAVIVWCRPR